MTNLPLMEHLYVQWVHANGLSPVCVLVCRFRSEFVLKEAEQFLNQQIYGQSPV